ncbi:MAG: hypothetical protein HY350_01560, partial [Candidatus Omnitrophica bacterium]|nr:hypothetical protein [Candidatus Omnitrophota bacterium]
QVYIAQVQVYQAQAQIYVAQAQIYKSKVQIYSAKLQLYFAKVQLYKAQAQIYVAKVQLYKAKVQLYKAKIMFGMEWWPTQVDWKSGKVEKFTYSQAPDEKGFILDYGTYIKKTYKINKHVISALFTEELYDQRTYPNSILEVKVYDIDSGVLVFSDVFRGAVSIKALRDFMEKRNVKFEERNISVPKENFGPAEQAALKDWINDSDNKRYFTEEIGRSFDIPANYNNRGNRAFKITIDDFMLTFDKFVNSFGKDASFRFYERTVYPLENKIYLLYDGAYSEPRVIIGPLKAEFLYPKGTYYKQLHKEYALDPRYFPDGLRDYPVPPLVAIESGLFSVGGLPYEIRGVTLSTVLPGVNITHRDLVLNLDSVGEDQIIRMASMGINTVRTYYPPLPDLLDAFAKYGIRVIVGFPYYDDRKNPGPDVKTGTYRAYIAAYKNHPAILAWEFGNEYNYHPEWFGGDIDVWYAALQSAATTAKEIDQRHPNVSSAYGYDLNAAKRKEDFKEALEKAPTIDIWGFNAYAWDDLSVALTEIKEIIAESGNPKKPAIYISETGADSWNQFTGKEDQEGQAKAVVNIWKTLQGKGTLGATFMTWRDEWWKGGFSDKLNTGGAVFNAPYDTFGNEEYFGFVKTDGEPKAVVAEITKLWANAPKVPVSQIDRSKLIRAPPIPQEFLKSQIPDKTPTYSLVIFSYFNNPQPEPEFLPSIGKVTYYEGETSDWKEIKYYNPLTKQTEAFPLASLKLTKFTSYTSDGQLIGYTYREPFDAFGRTVILASLDRKDVYLVTEFQDNNVYQPKKAMLLRLDEKKTKESQEKTGNKEEKVYAIAKTMASEDQLVDIKDIYGFDFKQADDIKDVIAKIKQKKVDALTPNDLKLVKTVSNIGGEAFYEYAVPGDEIGRTVIIDRAQTIFITQEFIDLLTIPYKGYFIDKLTGKAVLELRNTDDRDQENGLGVDDELRFYRVRYKNLDTGEIYYRWHYPYHIWGGWAYEERGRTVALDSKEEVKALQDAADSFAELIKANKLAQEQKDAFIKEQLARAQSGKPYFYLDSLGRVITVTNRWVPQSRLWIDEWSTTRDEAEKATKYNVVDGEQVLAYRTENIGSESLGNLINADTLNALLLNPSLTAQEKANLTSLISAQLRAVKRTYAGSGIVKDGKQEINYYLSGEPVKFAP